MVKFLLYLFESGLCLTILFLVYIFFFRKETYFKFNRIYLLSIMILSLLVPFMHIHITVTDTQRYEHAINEIGKFRTYYEQLIALTDPDYLNSAKKLGNSDFEEFNLSELNNTNSVIKTSEIASNFEVNTKDQSIKGTNFSIAQFIFIIYLLGILIFFSRIILLFHWIYKTISKHQIENFDNIKVIKLNKNLPPFSFLGYVFLNKNIYLGSKSEQILAHEKAHIKQFHSIDLLIAHAITILQWFNPFVWFLQKAIKTNHEYLADSKVVNKGFNLLDYQELLLNQFIAIPSVQLVNNFNLISIKNRITMMNKTKSGFVAKFKALLIIPAALFSFILFANLTLNGPGKVLTNLSFFEIQNNMNQLKGMWKNTSNTNYGYRVLFENNKFSVLEENIILKEYPYRLENNQIILSLPGSEMIELKYEIVNDQLKIWWNSEEYSSYSKSNFSNTLDEYLADIEEPINLPVIENYKLLQRLDLCIDVAMVNDKIFVNNKPTTYSELKDALLREKYKINHLNQHLITIRIFADKDLSMQYMNTLNQTLREIGIFKVAHKGKVTDSKVSKLQAGYLAMAKMLPTLDAKEIDMKALNKEDITLFDIDATNTENTLENVKPKFKELISNSTKYVVNLYYDETTILNTYIGYHDMIRSVIYEFRDKYASEYYHMNYGELSRNQQKEIKKKYPIIISEAEAFKNSD
ncbi:M56 family metallopeptidase [Bacteroidota bacterium]